MSASTFRDRLFERLGAVAISLTTEQVALLEQYWQLLERWNSKINLTALPLRGHPTQTIDRLIVEPLIAAALFPPNPLDWVDLGSGGGSPAIPLKVARPAARLTMIESRSRKAAFLREVLRTTGLAGTARVENARIEQIAGERPGVADWVTVRAVRTDQPLLDAAGKLLRRGGKLMLFESASAPELPDVELLDKEEVHATGSVIRVVVPRGTKG